MKEIPYYDIIKRPLLTEKTEKDKAEHNTYYFEVEKSANKIQIKRAVEKIFNVKVQGVRVQTRPGKRRRVRYREGKKRDWKRAVVKLKKDYIIDIL